MARWNRNLVARVGPMLRSGRDWVVRRSFAVRRGTMRICRVIIDWIVKLAVGSWWRVRSTAVWTRRRWRGLTFSRKIRLLGFVVTGMAVCSLIVALVVNSDSPEAFWEGLLTNAGTELLGMALTVLVLNELYQHAQEEQSRDNLKRQLIREMGSRIRDVALLAAEQLFAYGWGFGSDRSLCGADLRVANLAGAILFGARLQGANLSCAFLDGAHLEGASLEGADLTNAILAGANLSFAKLQGANLMHAYLVGANLSSARLEGADLSSARLQEGVKPEADFIGTRYDDVTVWPDCFDPLAAGAIKDDAAAEPAARENEREGGG